MKAQTKNADGAKKLKKVDLRKNGKIDLQKFRNKDKGKVPLRIDDKTIIYVLPENRNEEYAERYRKRMNEINYTAKEFFEMNF